MGYNTRFEIEPKGFEIELQKKFDLMCLEEPQKWYEYANDMIGFSMEHSGIEFIISGEGEEQGDVWKHKFKNGKNQRVNAEMVIPDFD